ncbi:Phosphoribosylformylglycinamidine synthase [Sphaceloma murrayae]|uniref:Phosphoribosylformylglycinamidine synthase n=1 Tax=Sphaceloma murrayae TaxID=2082308 RepID=A0A2K1R010_9PEZI|nr:Phosphoribosylformylglycinamidine synthase [Sphaceloma murrayae]
MALDLDRSGPSLIPIDFDHAVQRSIMLAQRKICGWGEDDIPIWDTHIKTGERSMFWIAFPRGSKQARGVQVTPALDFISSPEDPTKDHLLVGHVALDKIDVPVIHHVNVDNTLTADDGSRLTIATLFIMPEFKAKGLGTFAMLECERLARERPFGSEDCREIAVNTLSDRHCLDGGVPGPDGLDMFPALGLPIPKRSNVSWFEKLGYVRYKEEKRYEDKGVNGQKIHIWAVFLKKDLPLKA